MTSDRNNKQKDVNSAFQNRLRSLCSSSGESQRAIARKAGISQTALSEYLNNDRGEPDIEKKNNFKEPRLSTIVALADYFGVSVDYLLGLKRSEKNQSRQELIGGRNLCAEKPSPAMSSNRKSRQ